jgi:sugar lactone lactonase YvrE
MTSVNIQRKNTFLNWVISIAIGLVLSADLNATAGTGYQIETIVSGLNAPRGICVSGSDIYISDTGNNLIKKYNGSTLSTIVGGSTNGGYLSASTGTNGTLHSPSGIFFSGTGTNIYFSDNDRVRRFSTDSTYALNSFLAAGNASTQPTGVWANSTLVYFADTANNSIKKRNADGTGSTTTFVSGLAGPSGVCADASFIYFSELGGNIKRLSIAGGTVTTIASGLAGPSGICIDSAGNILFLEQGPGNVKKIPVGGGAITTIASGLNLSGTSPLTGLAAPGFSLNVNGICVDSSNKIYIAESGTGKIIKLSAQSTQTFTVATGASQTLSGTLSKAFIAGGGTAVLPTSNTISAVEVNNGTLQVSSSAPITFNASSGGSAIVEITAAINTGAYTFTTPGAVKIGTGIAAILDTAPAGSSLMSKTGAGRLRAIANLSSSTTPVAISEGILEVSSASGKLPNAITTVSNGGTLQLGVTSGLVAAGAVPNASVASGGIMSILAGATGAVTNATIASGGIVSVAAGVTAPSGMFTSATFRSGGILQVGDGATLGQSFNSVA